MVGRSRSASNRSPGRLFKSSRARFTRRCTPGAAGLGPVRMEAHGNRAHGEVLLAHPVRPASISGGIGKLDSSIVSHQSRHSGGLKCPPETNSVYVYVSCCVCRRLAVAGGHRLLWFSRLCGPATAARNRDPPGAGRDALSGPRYGGLPRCAARPRGCAHGRFAQPGIGPLHEGAALRRAADRSHGHRDPGRWPRSSGRAGVRWAGDCACSGKRIGEPSLQ